MGRAFEVRKASMMKTGMAKSKIYSRHSKEIYLQAKNGVDPENNLNLKRAIDKAKKDNVPADVIKRAIDKAKSGAGEDYKAKIYEGFGANGATIIVSCLTDNDNRTISDMNTCFNKSNSKLGVAGSVSHMYENVGVMTIKDGDSEKIIEALIENDLDFSDLEEEDGEISITCEIKDFAAIRDVMISEFGNDNIENDEITWLSLSNVELEGEAKENFEKLISMLNDADDVQNIYHNVDNI